MNLIVTCPRHFEHDAAGEIESIFEKMGFEAPEVSVTDMSGILAVKTERDPVEIVKKVSEIIEDEPWLVRYSRRIIPIHRTSASGIKEIVANVERIKSAIREGQTYRITVEKRHSELSSREIIAEIAGTIANRVSLEDPDWVVLVEILGAETGVAVVRPHEIVSVEKRKRSLSEED